MVTYARLLAVASLLVAVLGACTEPTPVTPAPPTTPGASPAALQAAAMERLRAESSVPLRARVDRDGAVRFARFSVPAGAGDPLEQALAFLDRYREFYRLRDPRRDLLPVAVSPGADVDATVRFHQRVGVVPVFASELQVHILEGQVRSTAGRYVVAPPAVAEGTLGVAAARERAASLLGAAGPDAVLHEPRPVVFAASLRDDPAGAPPVPAWRATVATGAGVDVVVLDATTGALLDRSPRQMDDRENFLVSDANNGDSRPLGPIPCFWDHLAPVVNQDGSLAEGDRRLCPVCPTRHPEPPREALDLAPNLRDVWNWYTSRFGHYGWDGRGMRAEAAVVVTVANAAFSPACNILKFRSRYERGLATVAHEFTHAVSHHRTGPGGLNYDGVTGALNESLSDTLGVFISGNWRYGEGSAGATCAVDGVMTVRHVADPPRCNQPDHYLPARSGDGVGWLVTTADNRGVHTNSGIFNKAAFLLTGSLLDADDAPVVTSTHPGSGIAVRGLGLRKSRALYYQVMAHRLSQFITQDGFRDAMIEQAELFTESRAPTWYPGLTGFNRFTREDVCSVRNAFAAVGVGATDLNCNGVDDGSEDDPDGDGVGTAGGPTGVPAPDNCPLVPNPDQANSDVPPDAFGDLCDPDIDDDGVLNARDNCPLDRNGTTALPDGGVGQPDTNRDGQGDACDDDECEGGRGDGVKWSQDNCPTACNPRVLQSDGTWRQPDQDGDLQGDACDGDRDGDGVGNASDNCPAAANPPVTTVDGGVTAQPDRDGDGRGDACDNCVERPNPDQANLDDDALGDACDLDVDGDGVPIVTTPPRRPDNCPAVYNPDQRDGDGDGRGAACDPDEQAVLRGASPFDLLGRYEGARYAAVDLQACRSTRCPTPPCDDDALCATLNRMDQGPVRFRVTSRAESWSRVVDDEGSVVAMSSAATAHDLAFTPALDFFWRGPDGALSARSYQVQVWVPDAAMPGLGEVHFERVLGAFPPPPDAGLPDAGLPDAAADAPTDIPTDTPMDIPTDTPMDIPTDVPADAAACPSGRTRCGGVCVWLATHPSHCGACGRACPFGQVCSFGVCRAACEPGLTTCPLGDVTTLCANLSIDPGHCGSCTAACPTGQLCRRRCATCAPGCVAPSPFCEEPTATPCGELCVDPVNDRANCGGCGIACAAGQSCQFGVCRMLL